MFHWPVIYITLCLYLLVEIDSLLKSFNKSKSIFLKFSWTPCMLVSLQQLVYFQVITTFSDGASTKVDSHKTLMIWSFLHFPCILCHQIKIVRNQTEWFDCWIHSNKWSFWYRDAIFFIVWNRFWSYHV